MEWKEFVERYNEDIIPEDVLLEFQSLLIEDSPYQLKLTQTLYRGIYSETPLNVHNNQFVHTKTIGSSWSKSMDVAHKFANTGEFGIVIEFTFSPDQTIIDFDELPSNLKYKNEKEVLVKPGTHICNVIYKR